MRQDYRARWVNANSTDGVVEITGQLLFLGIHQQTQGECHECQTSRDCQ
ncbi:hypothetical protein [Thiothrix sp. UBA2016]|nr:hypothetical protein [Thiothrix sp. UBA2016]MBJ6610177.1 hypothetical protein [Candidatus Thiothrix moscowensis]